MAYKHGQIYKRTNIVSTVYKPVSENIDWYAQEYDAKAFQNININDVNISLNVLKQVLKKSILIAKDIEDTKISSMRSFLKRTSIENARFNAMVESWSPKQIVYYSYQYNNKDLADFNKLLLQEKGLNLSFNFADGMEVNVLCDNQIVSKVEFKEEKDFNFFMDRMMRNEVPRAKGILFEEYMKGFSTPTSIEKTQEGEFRKTILKESVGSDMGVVDFLYTGLEEYVENNMVQYTGRHELMPVDVKFSSRTNFMLSIFKGIYASKMLLKLSGTMPEEFKGMDTFKRVFVEWLKQETSKALLMEAEKKAPGLGAAQLKSSLTIALNNTDSSVTKAVTISMALYKIVNNITETLKGNSFSNEFPVFVQNPGLYGGAGEHKFISDILFSSEILDSIYAGLFNGEHVLTTKFQYGPKKGIDVRISTKQIRKDSFNKAITSSGADIPVKLGDRPLAIARHNAAVKGVLDRVIFELNYGKIGG